MKFKNIVGVGVVIWLVNYFAGENGIFKRWFGHHPESKKIEYVVVERSATKTPMETYRQFHNGTREVLGEATYTLDTATRTSYGVSDLLDSIGSVANAKRRTAVERERLKYEKEIYKEKTSREQELTKRRKLENERRAQDIRLKEQREKDKRIQQARRDAQKQQDRLAQQRIAAQKAATEHAKAVARYNNQKH